MESPTTSERNEIQIAVMTEKITNIEKTTARIDTTLHDLSTQFSNTYVTKIEQRDVERRIEKVEALLTWAGRIILSAIIIGVLALLGLQIK